MSTKVTVNESPNKVVVDVNEAGEVLVNVFEGSLTVTGGIGSGDVVGPASATDNAITRFDGITGKLIQNSGITIADGATGTLSGTNSGDVTVTDTDTIDLTIAGQALSGAVRTQQSITSDASGIKLSGDSASPGNSQYYGTDGAGSKGFHALPVGTVTSVGVAGTDGIEVDSGSPVTGSGTITLGVNAATMKTTLDLAGTNTGDQNLFSTIAVSGQSPVVADTTSDTLTLVAGSNITITTDDTTDAITINSTASGSGDVVGPASATDNALARFDTTTGKLIQSGLITEDDDGNLSGVNFIQLDTTPTGSLTAQGQLGWNLDEETVDIQLNGFTLHVGEHTVYHVKNDTGSTIAKGVPVMFAGTIGSSGKLNIAPWNGTGPSVYFMGLTAEELSDGEEGFVIAFGKIRGIQTNGGNYGQTWTNGEIIYLGTTTGSLTDTQPAAPNPHVIVAAVVSAHATNGTLFIRPSLGSNIKDDEGVTITSLTSGQLLVANSAGTVFENKSVSGDATLANTGALTIASGAVSYAKMQDVSAASRLLGRGSAGGAGDIEEINIGSGLSLSGTTLSATVVDTGITQLTGDVTAGPGSGSQASTIANNAVTYAKIQDVTAASRLLGRGDSGSGDPQEIVIGTGLAMTGTTLSATGSGSGDMTKAVYDPRGLFVITGQPGSDDGSQTGGLGGLLRFEGGNAGAQPGENGGAAGTFTANGGNGSSNSVGGTGGSINTDASSIYRGGNINTSATGTSDGGDITTSGGGSIDTAGTGSIGLGAAGTRTTIQGAAVAPWTLTLPTGAGSAGQYLKTDGSGTTSWDSPGGAGTVTSVAVSGTDGIEVDSGSPITSSGTIQLGVNAATMKTTLDLTGTNSGDVTLAGTPDYITISGQTITRNAIDLAADVTGTLPASNGGTGITALGTGVATALGQNVTGSGSIVLGTSPTLTTPALGTPSALTLTNATGLPLTTGVTGILPIANIATGTPDGTKFVRDDGTLATPAGSGTVTSVGGTGTVNGITLSGTVTSAGNLTLGGTLSGVDLTTQVTGTLPIANGGTGQTTQTEAFDALAPTTTKGDIIVHNGTDNVRVPIGATNGHVLTVDSAEASGVKWAAGGGGGGAPAAIQVVKTDAFTTTSTGGTWADVTGLTVNITPSATSKRVLVAIGLTLSASGGPNAVGYRILRDATPLPVGSATGSRVAVTGVVQVPSAGEYFTQSVSSEIIDSPASTSTITYKIQITGFSGGSLTSCVNRTGRDDNASYTPFGISYIRVQEVD